MDVHWMNAGGTADLDGEQGFRQHDQQEHQRRLAEARAGAAERYERWPKHCPHARLSALVALAEGHDAGKGDQDIAVRVQVTLGRQPQHRLPVESAKHDQVVLGKQ